MNITIEIAGHLGWRKTLYALSLHYFWPNMSETVRAYVTQCPTCQRTKATKVQPPDLKPLASPVRPFQEITLDWVSGLPKDVNGNESMLNIVDRFSKWAISIPCDKSMTTEKFCDCLWERVFSWIGLPESIVGDRDTRLTASMMRALCTCASR